MLDVSEESSQITDIEHLASDISIVMTKFCPYCGKQLNARSKFCPQCGKAAPARERPSQVALTEPPRKHIDSKGIDQKRVEQKGGNAATGPHQNSGYATVPEQSRLRTHVTGARAGNGSRAGSLAGERRYAPATHSLIGHFESAGFGLRYGAWMFDFLITLIAIMFFTFIVTAVSRQSVVGSNRDIIIVSALTLLLFVINFVVLAGSNGQSAGMRILGIYIVRVDGRPFTIKDAAMRHIIGYPLSSVAFFLGFLWMLWDPRQQGWHDKLAGTIVVMSK
jgi:uncharacterized RDD family membrane protein YckC